MIFPQPFGMLACSELPSDWESPFEWKAVVSCGFRSGRHGVVKVVRPRTNEMRRIVALTGLMLVFPALGFSQGTAGYRVLSTSKTSTMQKEMQEAADAGFRYAAVMGGETAVGGKEVVVVMQKLGPSSGKFEYRLLATNKTSSMQKEMQEGADAGFQYVGQTVFESMMGGKEVVCILERDPSAAVVKYEYRLLATSKTSTMEKELNEASAGAYEIVGMTVAKTRSEAKSWSLSRVAKSGHERAAVQRHNAETMKGFISVDPEHARH